MNVGIQSLLWRALLLSTALLVGCATDPDSTDPSGSPLPDPATPALFSVPQARGISCLHCLQPEAHAQARELVAIALESKISRVALNVMVDGSFGYDEPFLLEMVDTVLDAGRELDLIVYVANGSSQRRYRSTQIHGFGTSIEPKDFRRRIMTDKALQRQYQGVLFRVAPVLDHAYSRGAVLWVVISLEDNLTEKEALKMRELLELARPAHLPIKFARNPCPSCYAGNDEKGAGMLRERHAARANFPTTNGIISNDGEDIAPENALASCKRAAQLNDVWILWDRCAQGLCGVNYPAACDRDYQMPSASDRAYYIKALRCE